MFHEGAHSFKELQALVSSYTIIGDTGDRVFDLHPQYIKCGESEHFYVAQSLWREANFGPLGGADHIEAGLRRARMHAQRTRQVIHRAIRFLGFIGHSTQERFQGGD